MAIVIVNLFIDLMKHSYPSLKGVKLCRRARYKNVISIRVPTQISFSNSRCFPCLTANFPCANVRDL